MTAPLKPCPFCGGVAVCDPTDNIIITCTSAGRPDDQDDCKVEAFIYACPDPKIAAERWNRRPREQALEAEKQELQELVDGLMAGANQEATRIYELRVALRESLDWCEGHAPERRIAELLKVLEGKT